MGALDDVLARASAAGDTEIKAARSDLAQLRQERDDARLMLRAALEYGLVWRTQEDRRRPTLTNSMSATKGFQWVLFEHNGKQHHLDDDGTGLPLLDAAAREALRRA